MRTSLDTNVLSALWSAEPNAEIVARRLVEVKQDGALLVSGVVYAELTACPNATESFVTEFLDRTGIIRDFHLQDAVWIEAARRFANYADRRRRGGEVGPKRLLADFLVGAHALCQADRLMTLDVGRYRRDFPELRLI